MPFTTTTDSVSHTRPSVKKAGNSPVLACVGSRPARDGRLSGEWAHAKAGESEEQTLRRWRRHDDRMRWVELLGIAALYPPQFAATEASELRQDLERELGYGPEEAPPKEFGIMPTAHEPCMDPEPWCSGCCGRDVRVFESDGGWRCEVCSSLTYPKCWGCLGCARVMCDDCCQRKPRTYYAMSFAEIGGRLDITASRASQLCNRAIAKLRYAPRLSWFAAGCPVSYKWWTHYGMHHIGVGDALEVREVMRLGLHAKAVAEEQSRLVSEAWVRAKNAKREAREAKERAVAETHQRHVAHHCQQLAIRQQTMSAMAHRLHQLGVDAVPVNSLVEVRNMLAERLLELGLEE